MFFVLSKIFWILAAPSHWLGFLVLATGLCLLFGRPWLAGVFSLLSILILVLAGTSLLNGPMIRALENRYPRPAWPAHVDGVLVLGSGFDVNILRRRHAPQANEGVNRLVAAMAVARHYPEARVVFSGGSAVLIGAENAEAVTARYVFGELGLEPHRLVLEPRARNTYENILFAKQLVKPRPGEVWLLDTAAIDMPRAMAVARKLDWPMIAWRSDFITAPTDNGVDLFEVSGDLWLTDYAVHEWLGILAYRLSGKAQ